MHASVVRLASQTQYVVTAAYVPRPSVCTIALQRRTSSKSKTPQSSRLEIQTRNALEDCGKPDNRLRERGHSRRWFGLWSGVQ